ncbi:ethanolamine ammonia-lyase subunit EutC [Bacillus piscicola]|uniref:ethanolamine ammonia-lyase subunit EutC n=1 Tax=Bacillus piscicola TaxID=1632684 RepID=UPI001F09BC10|nr:ethanolamine ammonia-lyase subunit EutC [Bacillus piscicola]
MDPTLVEKVTKLVLSKLEEPTSNEPSTEEQEVKIWNHQTASPEATTISSSAKEENVDGNVAFSPFPTEGRTVKRVKEPAESSDHGHPHKKHNVKQEEAPSDELKELMSKTPARIGVGRVGPRPKTNTWLKFRYDHAAAVDAVSGEVTGSILDSLKLFTVQTKVTDNDIYIRRPDYGRRLSDEAKKLIKETCKFQPEVQIIVSDGLSSKAVEENVEDVYLSLEQSLNSLGFDVGTPFYIEKGRVAVMDDVGELLQPRVVILLIGERPGLVSAESLSAYMCYEPRHGTIEADRMVVSNIHSGGIPPVEAGAYLGSVVEKIMKYEASGVSLVQKEQ